MKKIILSALIASSLVMAAESDNKLVTHTELGFIDTQGNTQTQTFNLDSSIKKNVDKSIYSLALNAQYATTDNVETNNKYSAQANYDYAYTQHLYFGYLLGYKHDEFSGFDYQMFTGPTVKYKAIKSAAQDLSLEATILYTQDKLETQDTADGYAAYGAGLAYAWQIHETLKFTQDLNYRAAFDDNENYFAVSKTALMSKISDIFSAGISYKVDYVNLPALGKEHTDRTFTANLIIDY